MKHLDTFVYVLASLIGFYWAAHLVLVGMWGVRPSHWYVLMPAGAFVLLIGTAVRLVSSVGWTRWVILLGSCLLAAYSLPATFLALRREAQLTDRSQIGIVFSLAVVLLALFFAARAAASSSADASRRLPLA